MNNELDQVHISYEKLKEKALSRSQTLSAIDAVFQRKMKHPKESKHPSTQSNNNSIFISSHSSSSSNVNQMDTSSQSRFLSLLHNMLGQDVNTRKTRMSKQLDDSFLTKSIVLENTTSHIEASSSKVSEMRKIIKNSKRIISKTRLKQKCLYKPNHPSDINTILILYKSWNSYVRRLLTNSISLHLSLQSRIQSMELIGASVIIIEAKKSRYIGRVGIITSATKNILSISSISIRTPFHNEISSSEDINTSSLKNIVQQHQQILMSNDHSNHNNHGNHHHIRIYVTNLERSSSIVGILLPSTDEPKEIPKTSILSSTKEDRITRNVVHPFYNIQKSKLCLLYGDSMMYSKSSIHMTSS